MNPTSAIAKGKMLEDHVAEQIRLKGLDPKAYRSHGSGNTNNEKGDIWTSLMVLGQNAGIECKNHKNIYIKDWWKQTRKLESLGREPILVYRIQGENIDNTLCTVYLDTLLDLIKASKGSASPVEAVISSQTDRDRVYALDGLKVAINKVLKLI
jgi:hypothetical protein